MKKRVSARWGARSWPQNRKNQGPADASGLLTRKGEDRGVKDLSGRDTEPVKNNNLKRKPTELVLRGRHRVKEEVRS